MIKIKNICNGEYPNAYRVAIKLPELVPPIISILILFSSNAFKTPACAIPLIPPPDRANPIFTFSPS